MTAPTGAARTTNHPLETRQPGISNQTKLSEAMRVNEQQGWGISVNRMQRLIRRHNETWHTVDDFRTWVILRVDPTADEALHNITVQRQQRGIR